MSPLNLAPPPPRSLQVQALSTSSGSTAGVLQLRTTSTSFGTSMTFNPRRSAPCAPVKRSAAQCPVAVVPLLLLPLTDVCAGMQFRSDQSKFRFEIRLQEERTRPLEVHPKNLNFTDEFDIELNESYLVSKVGHITWKEKSKIVAKISVRLHTYDSANDMIKVLVTKVSGRSAL